MLLLAYLWAGESIQDYFTVLEIFIRATIMNDWSQIMHHCVPLFHMYSHDKYITDKCHFPNPEIQVCNDLILLLFLVGYSLVLENEIIVLTSKPNFIHFSPPTSLFCKLSKVDSYQFKNVAVFSYSERMDAIQFLSTRLPIQCYSSKPVALNSWPMSTTTLLCVHQKYKKQVG